MRVYPKEPHPVYFADPFGNTLELVSMGYPGAVKEGPPDVSTLGW